MRRRRKKQAGAATPAAEPPAGATESARHVAVLVDGDNVPPDVLEPVVAHATTLGTVTERRVFRNWRSTRDSQAWDRESKRFAFERVDRYKTTAGKNSSDIAVVVEALDLFWSGMRCFVIVSGDTDFAPLVDRLRRGAAHVTIVGHHKDPGLLEEISDRYLRWRDLRQPARPQRPASSQPAPPAPPPRRPQTARQPTKPDATRQTAAKATRRGARPARGPTAGQDAALEGALVDAYGVALTDGDVDKDGWLPISRLGQIARDVDPGFNPTKYGLGARTPLYRLVQRSDRFELDRRGSGRGSQHRVRLR